MIVQTRWFLAVVPALLVAAACGGDSTPAKTPAPAPAGSVTPTRPATVAGQPSTDQGQPTPTKVPANGVVLTMSSLGKQYLVNLSDFKAMPQTEIEVNGKKQSGVLLAELVKALPPGPNGFVQIQGLESDLKHAGNIRFKLDEIATRTILVVDADGHVNLMSSAFPEVQWLRAINAIALS